ncbi:MAG: hypothetical protein A2504_12105 [Bdellovibrionales bacterium RIFOXYD12_FULL_39_22]|nr:MAG: hypothetical protein A2385_01825 [Bdellovibrionales bacterium RIFOXYB1_FULL_39_21]OFZ46437.1 MAG: hypothetical protein A2404_09060 [Bdellovibrionales bacterium RIFOXYC1_FULL_39_130]OFZ72472.1 MAG: hypothetical protein A2451_08985 [Bdellovibrionales bacterium RIFOXYC2_FULL_39_8]OFZ75043.1 MAG: hypothetical protein A2560_10675 [Bdellovibrionales bacterium RIFOXYD1_FULL_39_84]OFZ94862.1 MAG: hypothetical protein A2504_12105 [Bdellovibrionales bacterium RIFOXYD12_FULL_39_22]HLE12155.1 radi
MKFGIMLGFACNAHCEHCTTSSGPGNKTHLTDFEKSKIASFFNENAKQIHKVVFSGGEPFLYIDDINQILTSFTSISSDFQVEVITNAIFASSAEKCAKEFSRLKMVNSVIISYDEFHSPFCSQQNILTLVKYCKENNINVCASVTKGSYKAIEYVKLFSDLNVESQVTDFKYTGRGALLTKKYFNDAIQPNSDILDSKCPLINTVNYFPGKGFSFCCGHLMFNMEYNSPIKRFAFDSYADMISSHLYQELKNHNFSEILAKIKCPTTYTSVCDICQHFYEETM